MLSEEIVVHLIKDRAAAVVVIPIHCYFARFLLLSYTLNFDFLTAAPIIIVCKWIVIVLAYVLQRSLWLRRIVHLLYFVHHVQVVLIQNRVRQKPV